MQGDALLSHIAGHALVRSKVNRAYATYARRRVARLKESDPATVQEHVLKRLLQTAGSTRYGRDHGFAAIGCVAEFQKAVPIRTYEDLWASYLKDRYPVFEDLTWPGRIPYLALTSGTTQGATKYIPVSRAMLASNAKAARTMVAYHMAARPDSRLFLGKLFFLGGSSDLERPAPGVEQGDLSGIAARELNALLRPYAFPPLELALEPNWDKKLAALAERSCRERVTLVAGVPSWLLVLFQKLLDLTGKSSIGEVWPDLEVVVHGGVKFDPYRDACTQIIGSPSVRLQESYPCSEGFIAFGDPATGKLRLCYDHGIFYEFIPVDELGSSQPTRHWLGDVQTGVNYAIVVSTCAGMWGHLIGDTVRFDSLDPPLLTFTGRTKYSLSAFGEHLINEEVESAIAAASTDTGANVRDWHVGPVFEGTLGHHLYVIEFSRPPVDLHRFRAVLDGDLSIRNADYRAHRAEGVGLPLPSLVVATPGAFDDWMRARGKLGGQHKVPRMDDSGTLTSSLVDFLRAHWCVAEELRAGEAATH
jgi:GH3 auxin-responsive promoter